MLGGYGRRAKGGRYADRHQRPQRGWVSLLFPPYLFYRCQPSPRHFSPESKNLTWGVGPVVSLPTGDDSHGTGKWGVGPSLVVLVMPGQWVVGGLINNVWSVAGDENRSDVSFMTFQPFINYNFPDFYLTFSPVVTANWKADSDNQWTVPLGIGAGKLIRFGKLPVNINASYYNNVVKPENYADWTLRIQAAVLLPASIL